MPQDSRTTPSASDPAAPRATRSTRQRRAVEAELGAGDGFRTAQEIHEALRTAGESVGLATVYRTLQSLSEDDQVDVVKTAAGEAAYRRCGTSHHHHLVCRSCGRTVEIEGPAVERWATAVAEQHGYVDVSHTLELFGLCSSCHR